MCNIKTEYDKSTTVTGYKVVGVREDGSGKEFYSPFSLMPFSKGPVPTDWGKEGLVELWKERDLGDQQRCWMLGSVLDRFHPCKRSKNLKVFNESMRGRTTAFESYDVALKVMCLLKGKTLIFFDNSKAEKFAVLKVVLGDGLMVGTTANIGLGIPDYEVAFAGKNVLSIETINETK